MAISLNFNPPQVHGYNGYHGPRHGAHHGHHDGWFFTDLYHMITIVTDNMHQVKFIMNDS